MRMTESVEAAMSGLDLTGVDQAAQELARSYAAEIDSGGELAKLGPALLSCLESLGMTPRGRRNALKGAQGVRSPLDELRQRRDQRVAG